MIRGRRHDLIARAGDLSSAGISRKAAKPSAATALLAAIALAGAMVAARTTVRRDIT